MFSKVKAIINSLRLGNSSNEHKASVDEQPHINVKPVEESIIISEQRTESNEEDVTIVWFGKDTKNTKEQSFIGSLRSINDYIQVRLLHKMLYFFFSFLIDYFRFLTMKKLLWLIFNQFQKKRSF
jgi:hypothetical protein